jgi:hypothetical protein
MRLPVRTRRPRHQPGVGRQNKRAERGHKHEPGKPEKRGIVMSARVDPNRLYRLRPERTGQDRWEGIPVSRLCSFLFVEIAAGKPQYPVFPTTRWYCPNSDCVVRDVRIDAKYLDGPPPKNPKRMNCPSCGEPLDFKHYLEDVTLEPVSDA